MYKTSKSAPTISNLLNNRANQGKTWESASKTRAQTTQFYVIEKNLMVEPVLETRGLSGVSGRGPCFKSRLKH